MAEDKPKLLIVEDDPGLQKQLKWCFDDYEVIAATDRPGALAALRRHEPAVVLQDLGLPMEKTHMVMDKWGYTGSASVAMAFDDACAQGKVKTGDLVAFVASGVGYNMAGAAFRMV